MREHRLVAAVVVGTIAFWAYTRTLLPGVDFGDTGGFQASALWPLTSARRAYPLYYALATPFVHSVSDNPARALNLFSAIWAAVAAGALSWFVSGVTGSLRAGATSGLLLAFSYTFWTQAVIAEVYSLHLTLVCACMAALSAYAARPTTRRLALVLAVYALSFGNHLAMILLAVPITMFLVQVHPNPRSLLRPGVLLMALAIAAAGALQYSANLMAVTAAADAPRDWPAILAAFWFDTTKADWRESMVLGVPGGEALNRVAMWGWDARQQFGLGGLALAVAGAIRLWWISPAWAVFVWGSYAIVTAFALTYNVGDAHVFFLPGHFFTALAAGVAVAPVVPARRASGESAVDARARLSTVPATGGPRGRHAASYAVAAVAVAAVLYAGWRGWSTWPAVDRSADRRAEQLIAATLYGLDGGRALLVSGMDWETENALLYTLRADRTGIAWTRIGDVLPHFPFLVSDNHDIGRDVVLTSRAAAHVADAFGPLFPMLPDDIPPVPLLPDVAAGIPPGTPYVLSVLTPPNDDQIVAGEMDAALLSLTGGSPPARRPAAYEVIAGMAGSPPLFYRSADRPFEAAVDVAGRTLRLRMDAWMPFDTFRRGGFGHAILDRSSLLVIERGISLGWLDRNGAAHSHYAAGLYAPRPRLRIPADPTRLARSRANLEARP